MTQAHLSALCDMEQASLARIESGKANPTLRTLVRLANALEVDLSALFA